MVGSKFSGVREVLRTGRAAEARINEVSSMDVGSLNNTDRSMVGGRADRQRKDDYLQGGCGLGEWQCWWQ